MAGRYFAGEVLRYLEKNVRLNVYAGDIASDLNLTEKQVKSAVYSLKERKGQPIEVVAQGVWRYDPSAKSVSKTTSTLFELIGQTKQGKVVLQDEDGNLYVGEKL